ncbi:MAG: HVO_A0114 family putative DNA-binding protein [Thermoplasmatota archaeon]
MIEKPDAYREQFIALPMDPELLARIFTPQRIRLFNEVRSAGGFESLNALAEALGRPQNRVSRDVGDLSDAGLINVERHGKSKRIHSIDKPIILAS